MIAIWTGVDGEFELGHMSDEHIRNCIRAIHQGRITRWGCNGFSTREWVLIFGVELKRRARYAMAS